MYETSEIRKGLKIKVDGDPWIVVDFEFVKPGKGTAFTRVRIKNLKTGRALDRTYKTGERLEPANFEERPCQYLYSDGEHAYFMDRQNYEQIAVGSAALGEQARFLTENMDVSVLIYEGEPLSVELPTFIVAQVTYSEPGKKGDTATGATKMATVSTGAQVQVPLFVNEGDWLKIDTRNGSYVERAKK
ncbi:MAG: elongation factor P [Deltaproteobacteria bacterium]|nr:elongation factor P [Deltaproteobacteria bacterium]